MRVARVIGSAAAAIMASMLVAACSSSGTGPSASGGGTTSGGASSSALAGGDIVIGSICACTGATASSAGGTPKVLTAWQDWTNAHGGINGHNVKVITLDDANDAGKSLRDVKELVEQDHVLAIVGEYSNLDATWASYVQSKGVPVIGAAVFSQTFEATPEFFPVGAQNPTQVYGDVAEAKADGHTKIAVMYCAEAPTCANYGDLFKKIAAVVGGVSIVSVQEITATQPNYTAVCLNAKSTGADALVVLHAAAIVPRVTSDCAKQGFTPAEYNLSFTPGTQWYKEPSLNGVVEVTPNQSLAATGGPNAAFAAALKQYGDGLATSDLFNPANATSWASAEAFKLAAERAKVGPNSTPADVMKGLYTFKGETVGGLTPPLTFTKGQAPPLVSCYYVSKVEDGKLTAPDGTTAQCIPKDQLAAVTAMKATKVG